MYQPLPTIAEFSKKNKKKKSKSKRKSAPLPLPEMEMRKPSPGRDIGVYDSINMPLRAWSNLQQTSREARSWINLLRGRDNSRRPLL